MYIYIEICFVGLFFICVKVYNTNTEVGVFTCLVKFHKLLKSTHTTTLFRISMF